MITIKNTAGKYNHVVTVGGTSYNVSFNANSEDHEIEITGIEILSLAGSVAARITELDKGIHSAIVRKLWEVKDSDSKSDRPQKGTVGALNKLLGDIKSLTEALASGKSPDELLESGESPEVVKDLLRKRKALLAEFKNQGVDEEPSSALLAFLVEMLEDVKCSPEFAVQMAVKAGLHERETETETKRAKLTDDGILILAVKIPEDDVEQLIKFLDEANNKGEPIDIGEIGKVLKKKFLVAPMAFMNDIGVIAHLRDAIKAYIKDVHGRDCD